jgi:DNA-binding NarL/FixJ family response regulator
MINIVIINSEIQIHNKINSILLPHTGFKILANGKDTYDALKYIDNFKPDIGILDNDLGYAEGREIPSLLKIRSPSTAIVILVDRISDSRLFKIASDQISGLVDKETDLAFLPCIIKSVFKDGCYISPSLAARVLKLLAGMNRKEIGTGDYYAKKILPITARDDPTKYLSKTELQVLTHIGEGHASSEIAELLDLAVGTVRNYISSIMRKMGMNNRSQMARYALLHGLVPLKPKH